MSTGGVDLGQQDLQQRQSLRIQDLGFRVQGLGFCKFRVDFGFRFVLFFVFFFVRFLASLLQPVFCKFGV